MIADGEKQSDVDRLMNYSIYGLNEIGLIKLGLLSKAVEALKSYIYKRNLESDLNVVSKFVKIKAKYSHLEDALYASYKNDQSIAEIAVSQCLIYKQIDDQMKGILDEFRSEAIFETYGMMKLYGDIIAVGSHLYLRAENYANFLSPI